MTNQIVPAVEIETEPNNGAAPAPAPAPAPAVANEALNDAAKQILDLQTQVEALQTQLKTAAAVKKSEPVAPLGLAQLDIAREKAIRAVGGLAKWNQLTQQQREAILGVTDNVSNDEVEVYFGPKSKATAAAALAKSNPAKYRALRVIARERGIF